MWWSKPLFLGLHTEWFGKLAGASPTVPRFGDAHAVEYMGTCGGGPNLQLNSNSEVLSHIGRKQNGDETTNVIQISNKNSLIWLSVKINGQGLPGMLDSGANPNCISLRCVRNSPYLKRLQQYKYTGKQMVDANENPIQPSYVIKCKLAMGRPEIVVDTEFVVLESLPFSCIIGQQTLRTFDSWEVSNVNKVLTINKTFVVPIEDKSDSITSVNLITTGKTTIEPFGSSLIDVRASGPGLEAFRPISDVSVMIEGEENYCNRLSIEVLPAINVLSHQNCCQKLKVHNLSSNPKSIAKGVKIADCTADFEVCEDETVSVNLVSQTDPIDFLCNKITDLSQNEMTEARRFLRSFEDIFTVSNKNIGHTSVQTFDIEEENLNPVTVPLRRVPIHHRDIVQKLIDKYEQLHLLEPIESPFRASTVLIEKKHLPDSEDVTDKYRLCTDFRMLNNHLTSSGWPSPSLDDCLDAIGDANLFSSIDFNMGYFQIPCTERAKQILAFSPGYGFKQYTWSVMPPGVKTASSCFQHAMSKTFNGHEKYILPPFYDDVTIKSKGFKQHLEHAKIILEDVRAAKFTLNALKCSFFQRKIKYLGHLISEQSIEVDPDRVKSVLNLPAPQDAKGLRRFIGMLQFSHKFVSHLNVLSAPLYDLLKNKRAYVWSEKCQHSFEKLKLVLSSPPVLYSPSTTDSFTLETDASDIGLGGCLKASNSRGTFIVGYCSKKFVDNEVGWNIVEKEGFAILYGVRYFHHYLAGRRFTVNCDNRVNCYIRDKKKPRNKKLLGWALELSDYDYHVNHITSKNNNIADCLSRLMCMTYEPVENLSNDEFISEQRKDPECKQAIQYIACERKSFDVVKLGSLKRHRKGLHVVDGVLKYKGKFVVPQGLRNKILQLCHNHPMSGHFASERTYQRFGQNYFWPGAQTDVENFVNGCDKCNEFNPPRTSYVKAPLQPIETTERFQLVCYDIAGPFFPKTCRGNSYVLIIVDHFTHWPEFVCLGNIKASTIASALFENWCCRYGTPERFHSDGANNVHGAVLQELCKHFGVNKSKSSRLHPQGDGMAESFVKQLKSCIQKQVDQNGSDWDLYVQATAFAVRSNIAYNTKCTPAELVLGSKLTQPIDQLIDNTSSTFAQKQGAAFARDLKSKINNSHKLVNTHLKSSREQMKSQFDKGANPSPFAVGDQVMLWKPYKRKGLSGCFQPKWHGPWQIVKFTGKRKINCKIVNCRDPKSKLNVHVNQLKLVKSQCKISDSPQHNDMHPIPTPPSSQTVQIERTPGQFLDYLEDFEEDDNRQPINIEPGNQVEQIQPDEAIHQPAIHRPNVPQIDQRWVAVDQSNIIEGSRTRGIRTDYHGLLSGND